MPRSKIPRAEPVPVQLNHGALLAASQAATQLVVQEQTLQENADAEARRLGDSGSTDPDQLEWSITQHMRAAFLHLLDAGRELTLLKEVTPHGDFLNRIARSNITPQTAQRLMRAFRKFAKVNPTPQFLRAIKNGSKLIELIALDDEPFQELAEGGFVLDVGTDEVSCMSTTQLRDFVRKVNAKNQALEKLNHQQATEISELKLSKFKPDAEAEERAAREQALSRELASRASDAEVAFAKLAVFMRTARSEGSHLIRERTEQSAQYLLKRMAEIVEQEGLNVSVAEVLNPRPTWFDGDTPATDAGAAA